MKHLLGAAALAVAASSAAAEDIGLVVGSEDYRGLSDVRRGDEVARAIAPLERGGITVTLLRDADADDLAEAVAAFGQMAGEADRMLVVLSGRFAHSATDTFFLPTDRGPLSLTAMSREAVPLSVILGLLASAPGEALLVLATDETTGELGPFLSLGVGELALPQGVTLVEGEPRAVERFLSDTVARPGADLAEGAESAGVEIGGFLGRDQSFLPVPPPAPQASTVAPATDNDVTRDIRAWREADQANTAESYQAYIDAFPSGQFVRMAENRLQSLTDTPEARAERAEQALDLNRDQRREIQRDLSLLNYNTRGIDGIFGRGTRAAIGAWQQANGFDQTGFLTTEQITRLDAQAERRAAELEAEAEARRQEQLARDRAFWEETGAVGDEAGYRVYLERFPDGEYAEVARARLDEIERAKRAETDARDRQLWDEARSVDTVEAYRDYLSIAPQGAFRDAAAQRITELERAQAGAGALVAAQREEAALNLTPTTARVIESRLDRLGLKPGRVDGVFDDDTRRAIRRYQAARNMPETGYLNENVVVQLLADSVRQIFQ